MPIKQLEKFKEIRASKVRLAELRLREAEKALLKAEEEVNKAIGGIGHAKTWWNGIEGLMWFLGKNNMTVEDVEEYLLIDEDGQVDFLLPVKEKKLKKPKEE
jgi:hypothetical protein